MHSVCTIDPAPEPAGIVAGKFNVTTIRCGKGFDAAGPMRAFPAARFQVVVLEVVRLCLRKDACVCGRTCVMTVSFHAGGRIRHCNP
jgi:hypothetical protein